MNLTTHPDKSVVQTALDEIIHAYGLLPVVKALVARSLRRRAKPRHVALLDNHLRRDIGLPPVFVGDLWPESRR